MPNASNVTPRTIIAVGTALPALAAVAVALRFYVRILKKITLGCDDYLILFALVLQARYSVQFSADGWLYNRFLPSPWASS